MTALLPKLPRRAMSVTLAVSQASHLLSRLVTPVPLTQLPQRKPVVERGRDRAHLNHNDRAHLGLSCSRTLRPYLVCCKCTAGLSGPGPETQWTSTLPYHLCTTAGSGSNHGNSLWWPGPWYHLSWWWECPTTNPAWDEGGWDGTQGLRWWCKGEGGGAKRMGWGEIMEGRWRWRDSDGSIELVQCQTFVG